mmetsp:Transcript_19540/g.49694  ORF Transcript_19540/g.49694 Transcript_19540/m.49694 type:complete len:202 (-) Transcript_19540:963-1568(-)
MAPRLRGKQSPSARGWTRSRLPPHTGVWGMRTCVRRMAPTATPQRKVLDPPGRSAVICYHPPAVVNTQTRPTQSRALPRPQAVSPVKPETVIVQPSTRCHPSFPPSRTLGQVRSKVFAQYDAPRYDNVEKSIQEFTVSIQKFPVKTQKFTVRGFVNSLKHHDGGQESAQPGKSDKVPSVPQHHSTQTAASTCSRPGRCAPL